MSAQKQTFCFAFMTWIFFLISSAILRGETSTFMSRLERRQREEVSNLPRCFKFLTLLATSPAFGK